MRRTEQIFLDTSRDLLRDLPAYTAAPPARTAMKGENLETMRPAVANAMPDALALAFSTWTTGGVRDTSLQGHTMQKGWKWG